MELRLVLRLELGLSLSNLCELRLLPVKSEAAQDLAARGKI